MIKIKNGTFISSDSIKGIKFDSLSKNDSLVLKTFDDEFSFTKLFLPTITMQDSFIESFNKK